MESGTKVRFSKSFDNMPAKIKEYAKKVFEKWKSDPSHKSLKFKKIHDKENIYSVRIEISWRALGIKEDNTVIWFWIGSHNDYDNLIKSL